MSLTEDNWLSARSYASSIYDNEIRPLIPASLAERMDKAFRDEAVALARWHKLLQDVIANRR